MPRPRPGSTSDINVSMAVRALWHPCVRGLSKVRNNAPIFAMTDLVNAHSLAELGREFIRALCFVWQQHRRVPGGRSDGNGSCPSICSGWAISSKVDKGTHPDRLWQ